VRLAEQIGGVSAAQEAQADLLEALTGQLQALDTRVQTLASRA